MKKIIIALVTICVIVGGYFLIFGVDDNDVIGIRITEDGAMRAEMKCYYFPLRSEAEKFFKEKNIGKYFLFTKKDGKAETWFRDLKGLLDLDGSKTVVFITKGNNLASEQATDFIKRIGLDKIAQSSKEINIKKSSQNDKSNFVVHDTYSKEEAKYILMLSMFSSLMDEDFNKFVYSINKQHPYSYDYYRVNILQGYSILNEKLIVPNIRRANLNYYEIDEAVKKYSKDTLVLVNKVYAQRDNLSEDEISSLKKEYDDSKRNFDQIIHKFKNIMTEPAAEIEKVIAGRDASGKITQEHGYNLLNSAVKLSQGIYLKYDSTRTINGRDYYLYCVAGDVVATSRAYCVDIVTGELYSCSTAMKLKPLAAAKWLISFIEDKLLCKFQEGRNGNGQQNCA